MTAALSLVVQQLGVGACPRCLTIDCRLCPNPCMHMATAVCPGCEARWEYCCEHAEDCPAVAIARLSAACKATGVMRNQTEVQAHVQAYKERKDQFVDADDDAGPTDAEEELRLMLLDPRTSGTRELHDAWLIVQREQAEASGMF